jgi:hypothetical protein
MPAIFKNIRRKLASENKTAAYLRYALGEIILIVIGIMIALQVNDWNQRRILRNNIAQYTNSLKVDLAQDTVLISSRLKLMVTDTTKLGNFRDRMSAPGVTKDTLVHIARYEFHPGYYANVEFNDNTITSLRTTGHLSDLEKWLQKDLTLLNAMHQNYLSVTKGNQQAYSEQALLYDQHYPFNTVNEINGKVGGGIKPGSKLSKDIWKTANYTQLGARLNAVISIKYATERTAVGELREIQSKTKEILRKLNSETRK